MDRVEGSTKDTNTDIAVQVALPSHMGLILSGEAV